ncbi:Protein ABHD8 [Dissostichus eleginoides]|uniref:Protein ABHD8 n=1 Tax=Dissostichus eleginoides TaxID=100907 RepID=A0AAD9C9W1_DISEL|nr:Protein ABHD8 [Dissostichus eleginoides]
MLTSFIEGLLCCLSSKSTNVVGPVETSELADGYEFVEVKPGRVLRVRHIIPDRPVVEEPTGTGGTVSCKRKITVYRNGQLFIETWVQSRRAPRMERQNQTTQLRLKKRGQRKLEQEKKHRLLERLTSSSNPGREDGSPSAL